MTLETETVLDRRRMRRQVSYWRAAAVVAAVLALGALALGGERLAAVAGRHQIARVAVEGAITEDREQLRLLEKIAEADHVAALLVFVNSPGGTTAGGEALYTSLREVAKKKPVVAQFGTVAASAGYIVGLGTDYIVARGNTITGSVGVIVQWPELDQLLDRLGVRMNEIKSGELKATPSPFRPLDEGGRKVTEEMVADSFRWFLALVEGRRGVELARVPGLEKGRIFSGRQAQDLSLVDEIGGEAEAVRWLEEKRGVAKDLKVVDWKPARDSSFGLGAVAEAIAGLFGEPAAKVARIVLGERTISSLGLDGLLSVWHPSEN
jgi:protease-4